MAVSSDLGGKDRRHHGFSYLKGLLIKGGRKGLAQVTGDCNGDGQSIQRFVNQDLQDWVSLRKAPTKRMEPPTPTDAA